MSIVQWFLVGAGAAGLLWFWRWCVRWSLHDGGTTNLWGSMVIGVAMILTAVIWVPVFLVVKICTNRSLDRRIRKMFPPL